MGSVKKKRKEKKKKKKKKTAMMVLDKLTDKVYYSYKRFGVQILLMPKIKWCLDLMINNNH